MGFNPLKSGQLFQIELTKDENGAYEIVQSPKIGSVVSNKAMFAPYLTPAGCFNPLKSGQLFQIRPFYIRSANGAFQSPKIGSVVSNGVVETSAGCECGQVSIP